MAESDSFFGEESRKLAVLIARVWSNPALAADYKRAPEAVLRAVGVELGDREAPAIPERPDELAAQPMAVAAAGSSASSISCASCPCTGCTASCACPQMEVMSPGPARSGQAAATVGLDTMHVDAIMKLAEDPAGRQQARELLAKWDIKLDLGTKQ